MSAVVDLPVTPRYRDFKVKTVVDESLREGLERCMFPVSIDDLYRLFLAQVDAGIRDTIVGAGPADLELLTRILEEQDKGNVPADVRPIFLVLLNCWDATYKNFKKLPRAWIERTIFSYGMVEHKRDEKLFERVFEKFANLGAKNFKSSVLNNFSRGFTEEKYADMTWQIEWGYQLGIKAFRINDSVGKIYPEDVSVLCARLVKEFPDITFCLHCHNDRDLALANQLTSIAYGFQAVEGSLCGFGNRSGITPLEILASICEDKGIQLGDVPINVKTLCQNALLAEEIYMAVPNTYRPFSGRFVMKANFGVLNIPDFLGAEGERDYFLNLVNIHPNTILRALRAGGFRHEELTDQLVQEVMARLPDIIQERHAEARVTYDRVSRDMLNFYARSQLSTSDIVHIARQLRGRRPAA